MKDTDIFKIYIKIFHYYNISFFKKVQFIRQIECYNSKFKWETKNEMY